MSLVLGIKPNVRVPQFHTCFIYYNMSTATLSTSILTRKDAYLSIEQQPHKQEIYHYLLCLESFASCETQASILMHEFWLECIAMCSNIYHTSRSWLPNFGRARSLMSSNTTYQQLLVLMDILLSSASLLFEVFLHQSPHTSRVFIHNDGKVHISPC